MAETNGNTAFKHTNKEPGNIIRSADWNSAMNEVVNLGKDVADLKMAKVNRKGADTIQGPLTIEAALTLNDRVGIGGDPDTDKDAAKLQVKGNTAITGKLSILETLSVTGNSTLTGSLTVNNTIDLKGGSLQIEGNQKIVFQDDDTTNNLKLQLWTGYGLGINPGTLFYSANGTHSWRDKENNERMKLTTAANGELTVSGTGKSSFSGNLDVAGNVGIGDASVTTPGAAKLQVKGNTAIAGNLSITGASNSLTVAGTSTLTGSLIVNNTVELKGFATGTGLTVSSSGNVGIGRRNPVAALDIQHVARTDETKHPKFVNGLYVTGNFGNADGVEFRHTDGSQGIGFGCNTIYATGSNENQDLNLKPRGSGKVSITGSSDTVLSVAATSGSKANIDMAGHVQLKEYGAGNLAYLQARDDSSNRNIGLRIRTQRNGNPSRELIEAMTISPNGNVGIGTNTPIAKLDIQSVPRPDATKHPTSVKGLYVTGDFGENADGVEFRRTDGSQGIGFGYNTIYATGSQEHQGLNLKPRGNGKVSITMEKEANNWSSKQELEKSPANTLIFGGVNDDKIFFYWKGENECTYGLAIQGGDTTKDINTIKQIP